MSKVIRPRSDVWGDLEHAAAMKDRLREDLRERRTIRNRRLIAMTIIGTFLLPLVFIFLK